MDAENTIKTRKIFYLSGYDPRGFRFYYQSLKSALDKYCQRDNIAITLSPRRKTSALVSSCHLVNTTDHVKTDYSFLHWDDIIKRSWIRTPWKLFLQGLKSYIPMIKNTQWSSVWKFKSKTPIATSLYPFLSLITFPLFCTLLGAFIYSDYLAPLFYFIISSLIWIYFLPKLNSIWLLRFFIFNHQNFMHYSQEYDARAKEFAHIIQTSFDQEYDEIILVAHSNGSIASVPILKYLPQMPHNFKVLTLGHCVPLITMNRLGQEYIHIIYDIAKKPFKWFDIGFPPDGACYAKSNPLKTYEKSPDQSYQVQFKAISSQFFKCYDKLTYKKLLKDKFNLHFSYLITHDIKSNTEYMNILTSPAPLESRFK